MNRTHRNLSIAAVASMVALGGPGVMALADTDEADGVAPAAVSQGVNGHGEADENHDGRHSMWGGEAEDETESDDTDDTETEDTDSEESETDETEDSTDDLEGDDGEETESEDTETEATETEGDDVALAPAQAQGWNGHGEGDERHDGRHEKWGGTGDDTTEDDDDDTDSEEDSESDDSEESDDDGSAAEAQGYNGHGEGDESHDGRHEKWGGAGDDTTEDDADDTDSEESEDDADDDVEDTDDAEEDEDDES